MHARLTPTPPYIDAEFPSDPDSPLNLAGTLACISERHVAYIGNAQLAHLAALIDVAEISSLAARGTPFELQALATRVEVIDLAFAFRAERSVDEFFV